MRTTTHDRMMPTREAAEYLGLAESTLVTWRSTRRVEIPYVKLGRRVLYRQRDLDVWLDAQAVGPRTPNPRPQPK